MATLQDFPQISRLEVDFIEILLRQQDSAEALADLIENAPMEIIVHAPEKLGAGGPLLDLSSLDANLKQASLERIQSVLDVLNRKVPLVIHPGGVSPRKLDYLTLLSNLKDSLGSLEGVFWLENMPRGYHYGSDLLHCNLMLSPPEYLPLLDLIDGVTLDISHAYLSVPRGGNSAIAAFFSILKGRIRHVHLSDAAYPHREGLQLGEGDIDLGSLPRMRGLPVLLEIQGGHEADAAGFKEALKRVREEDSWFHGCVD